ncbi:MAG: small multi-drug export protein [Bacteroidia bacterium]
MLVSSVKFLAGPPIAYYGELYQFSFLEANLYCITGGVLGVMFFMFLSTHIVRFFNSIKLFFFKSRSHKPVKIFSKRSRRLVKFWKSYGLMGIALITPIILSIPIGTFIAIRLYPNKKKIFLLMFCSIVLWSIIITSFLEAFRAIPFEEIKSDDKV